MKPVKIILALDLILVNGALGFLLYKTQISKPDTALIQNPPSAENTAGPTDICGPECKKYIDEKLSSLPTSKTADPTPVPVPTAKTVYVTNTVAKTKIKTVSYVTIPGTGSTSSNSWQNTAGTDFYFDTSDYPGLTDIYFEANIKLFNGNGTAYARLFDASHGVGVQGSEVSTNNQADSAVTSGKVAFWAGKNLIRVQVKSLTADTAVYNYGRLRITTEN